ncbi:16S rRNA (uracil(1498)-N(3))-methyltransferase [Bifidobacterium minimum]|nr:16S rRNA (uracil(1498)-N(3))-methyltransferase [Bifidobacterium minimum]
MTAPMFLLDTTQDDLPLNCDELHEGWILTLPDTVRRHAIQSMRLSHGDELQITDGNGLRIRAVVEDAADGRVRVTDVGREPAHVTRIVLVQALAKAGHDDMAIDAATQIGIDEVVPWQSHRSIAKWKKGRSDRKWFQTLARATEQSRRSWMPRLRDCIDDAGIVAMCRRACVHGELVIVLHQDATVSWTRLKTAIDALAQRSLDDGRPRSVSVVVGPEGGIDDDEVSSFMDAGAQCCSMGSTIMRASVAGPAATALLAEAMGRFDSPGVSLSDASD